jgi:hypothetical protein
LATHWEGDVQALLQLVVPLQLKLPHAVVVLVLGQFPAPSQTTALVVTLLVALFTQLDWRQVVDAPGKAQEPFAPQVPAHAPLPPQAVRQQTPLAAQFPVEH